jgi:hypothetical protein
VGVVSVVRVIRVLVGIVRVIRVLVGILRVIRVIMGWLLGLLELLWGGCQGY